PSVCRSRCRIESDDGADEAPLTLRLEFLSGRKVIRSVRLDLRARKRSLARTTHPCRCAGRIAVQPRAPPGPASRSSTLPASDFGCIGKLAPRGRARATRRASDGGEAKPNVHPAPCLPHRRVAAWPETSERAGDDRKVPLRIGLRSSGPRRATGRVGRRLKPFRYPKR